MPIAKYVTAPIVCTDALKCNESVRSFAPHEIEKLEVCSYPFPVMSVRSTEYGGVENVRGYCVSA